MRIFILEDDPARIMWFERRFRGHDVTQVDTCAAIGAFKPPYDLICLDHDLGGRQMSDHEDNGEEFAKLITHPDSLAWFNADPARTPLAVIVHSFNPEGADRIAYTMKALCPNVFKIPFGSRQFQLAIDLILAHHLQ